MSTNAMATVSRDLPDQPHIEAPEREARELLDAWRAGDLEALDRIRRRHPAFRDADPAAIAAVPFALADARWVVAREYGFSDWAKLGERIEGDTPARQLIAAIREDDREAVLRLLRAHPNLLHVPLWSGNWGPPMSHAANLGRLEIVREVSALGARDHQHAFDRALLQGRLETARWLHGQGAKLVPGIVMGACECLNPDGLEFLAGLGAPFVDARGDRLAPLALVLETYGRSARRRHAVLGILARQGYRMPDSPMMAFHRGDLDRLSHFLRSDPGLLGRRFGSLDIYPPELGCAKDGRSGMHWTPIAGTTLLHLAVDFDDTEAFALLLAHGADVNARADVDPDGFGGHTPLFNAVVSHGAGQGAMARTLVERGASIMVRASLRKFLDWCETPRWHEALEVTPAAWGRTFPNPSWVNAEALRVAEGLADKV